MEKKILTTYFNPSSSGSFSSVQKLRKKHPEYSKSSIQKVLETQSTHTRFKPARHKFIRRKYNIHTSNYLWQSDLIVLNKYGKYNKNFKYIVTCIDCFSKRGFAVPIRTKKGVNIVNAFKIIFHNAKAKPKYLQCDLGTEFYNKDFKTFLTVNNVKLFTVHSDKKASIIERFNRTIMTRLAKWFHYSKTFNYVNVIDKIVSSYNRSNHRTTSISPINVNKFNEMDVWLHTNKDLFKRKTTEKNLLKVGDFVHVKVNKGTFVKGYAASYSQKLYTISRVLNTHPVTYKLKEGNEELLGIFYKEELSKASL